MTQFVEHITTLNEVGKPLDVIYGIEAEGESMALPESLKDFLIKEPSKEVVAYLDGDSRLKQKLIKAQVFPIEAIRAADPKLSEENARLLKTLQQSDAKYAVFWCNL